MHYLRNSLILILFTGCTPRESETIHSFRIYEESGVTLAETAGGPKYDLPPFRFEEILRVNQDTAIEASLLSDPYLFGPGPDSTLIVVERIEGRVVVYDSKGIFLRQIGSLGSGPGQFQRIRSMEVRGDSLIFYDYQLDRLSIFSINGLLIDMISTVEYGRQFKVDLLPDGLLVVYAKPPPTDSTFMAARIIRRATGEVMASLATGLIEQVVVGEVEGIVLASRPIPFKGVPAALTAPGSYILLSSGDKPEIEIYGTRGNLVRRIRLDLPPRKVTTAMRDRYWAVEARRLAVYDMTVDPKDKAEQVFPKVAGWWDGVVADDAGYLWIQDTAHYSFTYDPTDFFVFDPQGRYIGNVTLPSEASQSRNGLRFKNGLLFALVRDTASGGVVPVVYRVLPTYDEITYP